MRCLFKNLGFVLVIIFLSSSVLLADEKLTNPEENNAEELKTIQQAIKQKKAKWKAGSTSMSKLSPEERRKRLGAIKKDPSEEPSEDKPSEHPPE